jgi:type VI secretion system FHA domain protein
MPISVTVTDLDAGGPAWQAVLPEPLATIGRNPSSDLVLQDPDKHVSRLHASIEQRADGHYLFVNSKVNPILVDGVACPPGASVALRDGACVCMHPFELVVRFERAAQRPSSASLAAAGGDSFAWLGDAGPGAGAGAADPFGLNHAVRRAPTPAALPPDLFRHEPAPPQSGLVAGIGGADARGFSPPSSLDPLALLGAGASGLGRAAASQPVSAAHSLSLDALLGPATAGAGAPLVDFGGHQRAPGGSAALDHVHDFNLPFSPPPAGATSAAGAADASLDWLSELEPQPASTAPVVAAVSSAGAAPAVPAAPPPAAVGDGAAASAFLRGLGSAGIRIAPEQEAEFLEKAGAVVQVAVQGLVTLLLARGEIKKELRAEERTMLASRANNPLKFMGSADEALRFLFSPGAGNAAAFLSPAKAIEDACDELVAHELGLVAGMRAAVIGAIRRFDPATLEQKAGKGSALIPMARKARLWESYLEQYAQVERDMADNLDRLFERDFLGAYTDQVRRMGKK